MSTKKTNISNNKLSIILRKSVNLSKQTHILASNIDTLFLIITISSPTTSTNFIDRFLLTSNAFSINTVLLFNKIDLYDDTDTTNKARTERVTTTPNPTSADADDDFGFTTTISNFSDGKKYNTTTDSDE